MWDPGNPHIGGFGDWFEPYRWFSRTGGYSCLLHKQQHKQRTPNPAASSRVNVDELIPKCTSMSAVSGVSSAELKRPRKC